jgi:uncharacterized protein (DUF433 family)
MQFDLITYNSGILNGKPIIKGTRISIEIIIEWIASGSSIENIYKEHSHLPQGSVEQAIQYAARFTENEILLEEEIA